MIFAGTTISGNGTVERHIYSIYTLISDYCRVQQAWPPSQAARAKITWDIGRGDQYYSVIHLNDLHSWDVGWEVGGGVCGGGRTNTTPQSTKMILHSLSSCGELFFAASAIGG